MYPAAPGASAYTYMTVCTASAASCRDAFLFFFRFPDASRAISRVMSCVIIYPGLPLPAASSDPPENVTGSHMVFDSVLLRMGFTYARSVASAAVVSYTALPPLPVLQAVYFCCTIPGVASAGRYPASCPAKPGLSSPGPFRSCQPRLHTLLAPTGIL
jgi:hypothetical protein